MEKFGDLGELPENELIKQLWGPDGQQPTTAQPEILLEDDQIKIRCSTQGASIAYRWAGEERWQLYYQAIPAKSGKPLECKAIRLGWKESEVASKNVPGW